MLQVQLSYLTSISVVRMILPSVSLASKHLTVPTDDSGRFGRISTVPTPWMDTVGAGIEDGSYRIIIE